MIDSWQLPVHRLVLSSLGPMKIKPTLVGFSGELVSMLSLIKSPNPQKEMSFCHKLRFSIPYIFTTQNRRHEIFQTLNYVGSNILSLKYQRFTPSDCKEIWNRTFELVAKTQFLSTMTIC